MSILECFFCTPISTFRAIPAEGDKTPSRKIFSNRCSAAVLWATFFGMAVSPALIRANSPSTYGNEGASAAVTELRDVGINRFLGINVATDGTPVVQVNGIVATRHEFLTQ